MMNCAFQIHVHHHQTEFNCHNPKYLLKKHMVREKYPPPPPNKNKNSKKKIDGKSLENKVRS